MHVLVQETEPVEIDAKDKQILLALAENARKSYREIAHAVRLSPDGVKYRIARMQERHVLTGARTMVSFARLGLTSYHLFLSIHPPNKEMEAALVAFLQARGEVNAILQYLGTWDFELAITTRTPQELDAFRRDLLSAFPNIHDEQFGLVLETVAGTALPARLFPGIGKDRAARIAPNNTQYSLDASDIALLHAIGNDADLSIVEIMRKTRLTRDQVSYRLKRLVEEGVIIEFRPVVNYAALGYGMHAILLRFSARDMARERLFASFLKSHPTVIWAARSLGSWDMIIYVISKDTNDFYATMTEIRTRFGDLVKSYETLIAYKEHKYTYLP
jgi:Lrp/AsnC family leucine-responsive transcriptional regulator